MNTVNGHSLCVFTTYHTEFLPRALPNCDCSGRKASSKLRCINNGETSESREDLSTVSGICHIIAGWLSAVITSCKKVKGNHTWWEKTLHGLRSIKLSRPLCAENYAILKKDVPCDIGSVWSSMGFYVFSIHVPLSFGGLSIATKILHQPVLDSHIEAFLILAIQILELSIVLHLLRCPGKPQYELSDFFNFKKSSSQRSWLLASVLGCGFLFSLVYGTSTIAERLTGPKDVNAPFLKQILSSGSSSVIACSLIYCIVTPFLEEVVYRGFLLTSLASKMKWQQAVIISSIIFSAAHFSFENFLQLFVVGLVLGSSYCWTGSLNSSIAIHSLYNALTLFATFMS